MRPGTTNATRYTLDAQGMFMFPIEPAQRATPPAPANEALPQILGLAPQDVNALYAATVPTPGKRAEVFASSDGGATFRNVTGALPDRYVVELWIYDDYRPRVREILTFELRTGYAYDDGRYGY